MRRQDSKLSQLRARALVFVESPGFTWTIAALIVINAVVLGLETFPALVSEYGNWLLAVDRVILLVFVVELSLRLFAHGSRFLRDPWSIFDTVIILIAFVPANQAFSVLRALRVLRVLRLISVFPQLRRVVQGLLSALPGLGSILAIMAIVFYVFAVIASKLYGQDYPQWFGSLDISLFTLFQIMTLEGWADIARTVKQTHPYAWVFFVTYIVFATFTVLNLFIAVIVDAMQKERRDEEKELYLTLETISKNLEAVRARMDEFPRSS